ncbi:TPA: hypothetical protein ACH3X1_002376 [Trebouxia sp. C0004]
MFPTDSLTRAQSSPRPLARYYSRLGGALASTSCPACVRRHLRVGTIAPSLLSTSWEQAAGSSTAGRSALPAQITSACQKRSAPRLRTANILVRADRQSMDSSVEFPTKPEKQILTLPTILTLMRVASIPLLIGVWFSNLSSASIICSGVFIVACLTDYLDGYLARRMDTTSAFGAFLDPVADKLMVATVLILLATEPLKGGPWAGNTWLLPSLSSAIIGREITMSALREWAASCSQEAHQAVAVSSWGKWKTATQMTAISLLLATSGNISNQALQAAAALGPPLLCVATLLTLWSLATYMRGVWPYM